MRAVVQRVSRALVRVGDETVDEIGPGLSVLVGVTHSAVMNRSVVEAGGGEEFG